MWNLNNSLIIIASLIISCFSGTKVILPRLKYFLFIILFTLGIVVADFFAMLDKEFSTITVNILLALYFFSIIVYLEKNTIMGTGKVIRKKTMIPYLVSSALFILSYVIFVLIPNSKSLPFYTMVEKYCPVIYFFVQGLWIFVEMLCSKNKKISICLSLITIMSAITYSFFFNEKALGMGVLLTLLFLYNGVENNTNYYDINAVNYNANIFKLAYSNKKVSSKKALVFIRLNSKDVNKNIALNKVFGKTFFKFKKNVFGMFINYYEFALMMSKKDELISFKLNGETIKCDYKVFYVKHYFYNKLSTDIGDLINYLASCNKSFKHSYEITEKDLEEIIKTKKILEVVKDAVNNDGFELYYQPIYSTEEKKYSSAEALLRIKNTGDLGYVSPEIFIPIAENYGLADKIGNIVFEKVCDFFAREKLEQYGIKYIEINVSGLHIVKDNIVEDFKNIVNKYNLNPEKINIEITETAQISNQKKMNENLKSLRELGFKFSMDDFGSGYSNMTNIIENNYELIKIDKSIVWGALKEKEEKSDSSILLETCISLGHKLKRKIVAEGVESEDMVNYLEHKGVEYLQGYHFSTPVNEVKFVDFIKSNYQDNINRSWL